MIHTSYAHTSYTHYYQGAEIVTYCTHILTLVNNKHTSYR